MLVNLGCNLKNYELYIWIMIESPVLSFDPISNLGLHENQSLTLVLR